MSQTPDVVIVGGGIAGSALATVLARGNVQVAVLEQDLEPVDRVRGESLAPWGVIELRRLGLYDALVGAGGVFSNLTVPYDENLPGEKALPFALRFTDFVPEVPGMLCMSHPALCRVLAAEAEAAGAVFLRGATDIAVTAGGTGGAPPQVGFSHGGQRLSWTSRLVVGADGRHSPVRRQVGFGLRQLRQFSSVEILAAAPYPPRLRARRANSRRRDDGLRAYFPNRGGIERAVPGA